MILKTDAIMIDEFYKIDFYFFKTHLDHFFKNKIIEICLKSNSSNSSYCFNQAI